MAMILGVGGESDEKVERVSGGDEAVGQARVGSRQVAMDAALVMELIAQCAARTTPQATALLDVGCGAGDFSLKILGRLPDLDVTLVDLSQPMLTRAQQRIGAATRGGVTLLQGDIRELELGENVFDIIVASAVLHHLRTDAEWEQVFANMHRALRPGGALWVWDLVTHDAPAIQDVLWRRYGEYLTACKGETYRDTVFAYIEQEDTPRPLLYQCELMRRVGFRQVEVLHKTAVFAAFGGIK
jgi:tRNA (cmo5U34)-methyltransferase